MVEFVDTFDETYPDCKTACTTVFAVSPSFQAQHMEEIGNPDPRELYAHALLECQLIWERTEYKKVG